VEAFDAVNEYGEVLSDGNIAQFLATQNWTCQLDREYDQIWVQPNNEGERVARLLLPREKSFVDYNKRLYEAVNTLTQVYDWRLSQLAEQVAAIHADLFFVRIDQNMSDGTIPLRQASALLENIDQMIRSAAVTTYNPYSSGKGRTPSTVNDFLNDDVRMGHTKRGSFIITVAARLDDPVPHAKEASDDTEKKSSFTRQVMTTLSRSLDATRRFTAQDNDFVDFDEAVDRGVRLPLIQALHDMGDTDGVRSLDLSFEWAASEPQKDPTPKHVHINRKVIEALPEVEKRLSRNILPERQTIVGPVIELKRSDVRVPGSEETYEIVVRSDINGRWSRITVPLTGTDYDWAIRAHRERLPFTVTGELGKKGNSWRLGGRVVVDHSFLEHHFGGSY